MFYVFHLSMKNNVKLSQGRYHWITGKLISDVQLKNHESSPLNNSNLPRIATFLLSKSIVLKYIKLPCNCHFLWLPQGGSCKKFALYFVWAMLSCQHAMFSASWHWKTFPFHFKYCIQDNFIMFTLKIIIIMFFVCCKSNQFCLLKIKCKYKNRNQYLELSCSSDQH